MKTIALICMFAATASASFIQITTPAPLTTPPPNYRRGPSIILQNTNKVVDEPALPPAALPEAAVLPLVPPPVAPLLPPPVAPLLPPPAVPLAPAPIAPLAVAVPVEAPVVVKLPVLEDIQIAGVIH
ncbi:classical arabinogalactan protein 9-like [Galendromus occidentalis]|uniref:Classical arabinogalactan protein 9-like n=1 Tax=Galendromus occidentalis TaxID=34638 RepID=A0AAJ7L5N3_9ACAR|nr:classical arabinogalactan protein 9-like [Galendromus occidentalis]